MTSLPPSPSTLLSASSSAWTRVAILYISFTFLAVAAVLCGSAINSDGLKYSTVKRSAAMDYNRNHGFISYDSKLVHAGASGSSDGLENNGCVVALNVPNSLFCCDDRSRDYQWICIAAFDPMNKIFTKSIIRAVLFPLLPVLLSGLGEFLAMSSSPTQRLQVIRAALERLLTYIGIIAFRTCILYMLPLYFFSANASTGGSLEQCWCPELVSTTKCNMDFDFSDHVVLAIVQFITPCLLEMGHVVAIISSSSSNRTHLMQLIGFVIALIVILIQIRGLFFTAVYFHTPLENIVGLVIASVIVLLPICLLSTLLASTKVGVWFRILIAK